MAGVVESDKLIPTGARLPIMFCGTAATSISAFAQSNKEIILGYLLKYGAILFREFNVSQDKFSHFMEIIAIRDRVEYKYRSTPRQTIADKLYTTTEYPASLEIPIHCENSYQLEWPLRIGFYCVTPAADGGRTPLVDVVRLTNSLPTKLVAKFRNLGVQYVRHYHPGVDLDWREVFQCASRAEVESICGDSGIEWAWIGNDVLMTAQTAQGTAFHPDLGSEVWFNQANLFHLSSLGKEAAQDLMEVFGDRLPRNANMGDGNPICEDDLDSIRGTISSLEVSFEWHAGDVLLLDNMQVAHGRKRFRGKRRVLAAMNDVFRPIQSFSVLPGSNASSKGFVI